MRGVVKAAAPLMLPRERREIATQDHVRRVWTPIGKMRRTSCGGQRRRCNRVVSNAGPRRGGEGGRWRRGLSTAAPVMGEEKEQHDNKYSCFKKEKPATSTTPEETRSVYWVTYCQKLLSNKHKPIGSVQDSIKVLLQLNVGLRKETPPKL
ncbi:hypothetical protein CYMTET_50724 [Cymbomonas tetramitiformis]|uniref:Uncharacterized protein n=1 Tax=Cymbomonas tetramitiformis TaxID=36881 RepID=A0AAE0BNP7_9CHLO|nr:hypothetical protein CYMTET_50724 [Cymbomonas tetramitiformis]